MYRHYKVGNYVILSANPIEGWVEETAHILEIDFAKGVAFVFCKPSSEGDDGYREVAISDIKCMADKESL